MLSIVTFNYDLTLEAYFLRTLKVRHVLSDEQAIEAIKNLRIQHIYGDIGPLVAMDPTGRKYGSFVSSQALRSAAARISTCFEPQSTEAVAEAQRQIHESECVLFLGFGYTEENLRRLDLKSHLRTAARVGGSTVGCENVEIRMRPHLHPGMSLHQVAIYGTGCTQNMLRSLFAALA